MRGRDQLVAAAGLGEQDPLGADQAIARGAGAGRDPRHRVRQVAVEAREEAEPVLGGKPRLRRRVAARLPAGDGALLVDRDREPALGQLVGGAQTGDAAPENRHARHAAEAS